MFTINQAAINKIKLISKQAAKEHLVTFRQKEAKTSRQLLAKLNGLNITSGINLIEEVTAVLMNNITNFEQELRTLGIKQKESQIARKEKFVVIIENFLSAMKEVIKLTKEIEVQRKEWVSTKK